MCYKNINYINDIGEDLQQTPAWEQGELKPEYQYIWEPRAKCVQVFYIIIFFKLWYKHIYLFIDSWTFDTWPWLESAIITIISTVILFFHFNKVVSFYIKLTGSKILFSVT